MNRQKPDWRRDRNHAAGSRGGRTANILRSSGASSGAGTRRVGVVLGVFAVACVLLLGRAVTMNLADGSEVTEFMARHIPVSEVEAVRGDILSANGRTIATSVQATRVIATPYEVSDPQATAAELSALVSEETGQTAEELEALLSASTEDGEPDDYSEISTVTPQTADSISKLGLEGIYLQPTTERVYPDGRLAAQIVGYAAPGGVFGGVESRYDETLASGRDVTLTIDTAVQQELQAALAEAVDEFDAKNAVGVVMRAEDGAVIALANSPTYDNNEFTSSTPEEQRNRAVTDPYEPGSTLKPFTFAGAIEENAVARTETFTVPDHISVADLVIQDSISHETEVMTLDDILSESSNVGTILVARALGETGVHDYLARFGFGEATGFDLGGEDPGDLPATADWSGVSIGNIPIGQGLTVTPLQLAGSFSTLVNGGQSITPHVIEPEHPVAGERVISERTSDIVSTMLQATVEDGTGHLADIPGYTVGGKTGTSQKVDPKTGTYGEDYYASFVGFAPVGDPEYVTLIVVDEPKESIWGESVAAPAFQRVMKFTLGYFNVAPDKLILEERSATMETNE